MIRYAAIASDGSKLRADTREAIDRWAAVKCAEGLSVEVFARKVVTNGSVPERVGYWRPPSPVDTRTALDVMESAGKYRR